MRLFVEYGRVSGGMRNDLFGMSFKNSRLFPIW